MKRRSLLKAIALAPFAPNALNLNLVARAAEPPKPRFIRFRVEPLPMKEIFVTMEEHFFRRPAYTMVIEGSHDDKHWFDIETAVVSERFVSAS